MPQSLSLVFLSLAFLAPFATGQQNVLVLVADDLGVDKVGVYAEGVDSPPTPNIDALAQGGVMFRNAWVNPACSPSRACFLTGRYSLRTRVGAIVGNASPLSHREVTLPEMLALGGASHATAAIGKWHLGSVFDQTHPNDAGFDYFAGMIHGSTQNYFAWPRTEQGQTGFSTTYATTRIVDDAVAWIDGQAGPWVCYVAFNAPHAPFHEPPAHLHSQDLSGLNPQLHPTAFYDAMVEAMDTEIGRLLGSLDPAVMQDTNVIFVGDNGTDQRCTVPPFLGSRAKGTPYEGGVNVPLIVSGPAVDSPGREVGALVGGVDIFATIGELLGIDAASVIPATNQIDAVSFAPYLTDPAHPEIRTTVFAEYFDGSGWSDVVSNGFATIRDSRYKLIQRFTIQGSPTEEFYDLLSDPFESADLIGSPLDVDAQAALVDLRAALADVRVPQSAFSTYGALDCQGSVGAPTIAGVGVPSLGGFYDVSLANAPAVAPAALFIGFSDSQWGTIPLPFDLILLGGGPGCRLYSSTQVVLPATTDASGLTAVTVSVPAELGWVGAHLFHTWLVGDLAAPNNLLGVTSSNGLAALIGY